MATDKTQVTIYLPDNIIKYIEGYCQENGLTRKDGKPVLATGITKLLEIISATPSSELSSNESLPIGDIEDLIEKKLADSKVIDTLLSTLLNEPYLEKIKGTLLDTLPSTLPVNETQKDFTSKDKKSIDTDYQTLDTRLETTTDTNKVSTVQTAKPVATIELETDNQDDKSSSDNPYSQDFLNKSETLSHEDKLESENDDKGLITHEKENEGIKSDSQRAKNKKDLTEDEIIEILKGLPHELSSSQVEKCLSIPKTYLSRRNEEGFTAISKHRYKFESLTEPTKPKGKWINPYSEVAKIK